MLDENKIRLDFPMLKKEMQGHKLVYLDSASTTLKPQCVIDACSDYYLNHNANSHRGDYDLAYYNDIMVAKTREEVSKLLNCDAKEVVFTSGATLSINLIAYGIEPLIEEGSEILLEESNHASNLLPWYKLAKRKKANIKFIPLNKDGVIDVKNLQDTITNKTRLVAFSHVSNVLGNISDAKSIIDVCHKHNIIVFLDCAQSVPHMKVDFKDLDADFICFSGHKMCGPTGIGCLIGKYDLLCKMDSFVVGGGMNVTFDKQLNIENYLPPMKFEAGTLNLSGIYGLKRAIEYILEIGLDAIHEHDQMLIKRAKEGLKNNPNVIIYNENANNGILAFNVKGVFAQDEASLLNSKGIAIRSGEHCAKILNDYLGTRFTCRLSTYLYTSIDDIDYFVKVINEGGDFLDAFFN